FAEKVQRLGDERVVRTERVRAQCERALERRPRSLVISAPGLRAPEADQRIGDVDVSGAIRALLDLKRLLGERQRRVEVETVRRQIAQIAQAEREARVRGT